MRSGLPRGPRVLPSNPSNLPSTHPHPGPAAHPWTRAPPPASFPPHPSPAPGDRKSIYHSRETPVSGRGSPHCMPGAAGHQPEFSHGKTQGLRPRTGQFSTLGLHWGCWEEEGTARPPWRGCAPAGLEDRGFLRSSGKERDHVVGLFSRLRCGLHGRPSLSHPRTRGGGVCAHRVRVHPAWECVWKCGCV